MSRVSRGIDGIAVSFDDPGLVANAGLLLVATLVVRLGLEALINSTLRLGSRVGGAQPGRKVLTLVHAMVAGGSHIDHADILRSGATGAVLGHRVMAPSTLGTFLRACTFGHVRELEAVIGVALGRAWGAGGGPGGGLLVVDVDSTICEVFGKAKQGAAYGYTKVLGFHPIVACRADTGEILHARLRKGSANTARGARRFIEELIARVRRAGANGAIALRFDSGFWSNDTISVLGRLDVRYTMAVRTSTNAVARAIATIAEGSWQTIDYPEAGEAQVSECLYGGRRLVVRRTRLRGSAQAQLWPDWRHFAFLTDLGGDAVSLDAFHRQHAVVELAIRDIKEAGLDHVPSGNFSANGAWLCCAVLAHDLLRWSMLLGEPQRAEELVVARSVRMQLIAVPARLVNRAGRLTLRGPSRWPWAADFQAILATLRAVRPAPG